MMYHASPLEGFTPWVVKPSELSAAGDALECAWSWSSGGYEESPGISAFVPPSMQFDPPEEPF